jgi:hypothetical protein
LQLEKPQFLNSENKIQAWRFTDDAYHLFIVAFYFQQSAVWKELHIYDITTRSSATRNDPMFVLEGTK